MGAPRRPDQTPTPNDGDTPAWDPRQGEPGEVREPTTERYAVRGELGRGGLGRVLEADDRLLGRPVAIKELLRGTPGNRARFLREIRITARLQHPAIVPIYDALPSPDGGLRYAMRLVDGVTLADAVAATKSLEERLALLPRVLAVAEALAYAHARGVLHRDVKPSNILLGPFGETLLIDWGVAKDLGDAEDVEPIADTTDDPGLTRTGAIVGTPAYMAPEQARGEPADRRSDVYALGATLHHLLAGRPPFTGSAEETLRALRAGLTAPRLDVDNPALPPDLVSIVRHATAENPADRYPSAQELRQDLQRFSTGQLVAARVYTTGDLVGRWLRRHRVTVAIGLLAASVVTASAGLAAVRVVEERNLAREAQGVAESRSNALTLAYAARGLESDPTEAASWLAAYPSTGTDVERLFTLAQAVVARGVARVVVDPTQASCSAPIFTRDGRSVLAMGDITATVDVVTGAVSAPIAESQANVGAPLGSDATVVGTPIGTLTRVGRTGDAGVIGKAPASPAVLATLGDAQVFVGDRAGGVSRVDVATGTTTPLLATAVRINGLIVADRTWTAASGDGTLWTGPTAGGAPRLRYRGASGLTRLASLGGDAVAVGDETGAVVRVDEDGSVTRLLQLPGAVRHLAVGDGGKVVFASDGGSSARVSVNGTVLAPPWGEVLILGLDVAPNDGVVAAALEDGTLHLWRPATGDHQVRRGRTRLAGPVAFAPDGRTIATCSTDSDLRLWPVPPLAGRVFRGHTGRIFHALFLPDGRVATDSDDNTVRVWGDPTPLVLQGHTDQVYGLDVRPDGRYLVDSANDALAMLWDLRSGVGVPLRGHEGRVRRAVFTPDGERVVTGARDGELRLWALDGSLLRHTLAHVGGVHWLAFGTDGREVWSVGRDRRMVLWDPDTGAQRILAEGLGPEGGPVLRLFPLDPDRALTCAGDRALVIVDKNGSKRMIEAPGVIECAAIQLSPDRRSAAVPVGTTIALLDLGEAAWRTLEGLPDEIQAVTWSPDGRLLGLAALDGTARLYRVSDGAAAIVRQGDAGILAVQFSPDGRRLAAGGVDQELWVGPVDETILLPRDPTALRARVAGLTLAKLANNPE